MGNQQAKISELNISWFAGFVDGEGSFCFVAKPPRKGSNHNSVKPTFSINNCDVPTLHDCTELLETYNIPHWIWWRRTNHPKHKMQWCLRIDGHKRLKRFLIWVTPYLHTKRKQAENILDFLNLREGKVGLSPYTDKEKLLVKTVKDLNRKGPNDYTQDTADYAVKV